MPKKVKIQQIQPDPPNGPTFGQVSNPSDVMKLQIFAHAHAEILARDFIVGGCADRAVAGFEHSLPGGMIFRVLAPGQVIDLEGKSYELIDVEDVDNVIANAHATLDRIDLVVVVLETDQDAADELRPFVQLRTQDELDESVPPYPPTQFNEPAEQHTRAVIIVKAGDPAAAPVPPTVDSNEQLLYAIRVPAASTEITAADVTDLRHIVASNCVLQNLIEELRAEFNNRKPLEHRHWAYDVDLGPSAPKEWQNETVQAALDYLLRFSDDEEEGSFDPIARPHTMTADGRVGAVADLEGATPVIDLPVDLRIAFSDRIVPIKPDKFPASVNARLVNKSAGAGEESESNTINFSLGIINSIESDGGGEWKKLAATLPATMSTFPEGRKAAARDGRYLEIFGLGGTAGSSSWHTFDTLSPAAAPVPRAYSGVQITQPITFAAPCGDGNILIFSSAAAKWYLLDAETGVNAIIAGPGSDISATRFLMGDLIQTDVVLIIIDTVGEGREWWVYHVDTNTFEELAPAGPSPGASNNIDVCMYQPGQAVIFSAGSGKSEKSRTVIFDYPTRTFSELFITPPTSPLGQTSIARFRMANINGRPQIAADVYSPGVGVFGPALEITGKTWELTPESKQPQWRSINTALPSRWDAAVASLLVGGLPKGAGYLLGGQTGSQPVINSDIWEFKAAGIIETQVDGVTGITLGPGVTQASFRVGDFELDWEVETLLVNLKGILPPGSYRLSYSLDGGLNFQEVMPNKLTTVLNASDPSTRVLKITLISAGKQNPVLQTLVEKFETAGGPGFNELVLRYDCPAGTQALYISRDGSITLSATIEPTLPGKAILMKHTHNGGGMEPDIDVQYRNKRRLRWKFTGVKVTGSDPSFQFDFGVTPDFIDARKVSGGATGALHQIAEPVVEFDEVVTITGLTDDDVFIIECAV